ncbi:MAG: cell division topological specificity factor MinE [Candidatus Baltobacteraceae bacterium]
MFKEFLARLFGAEPSGKTAKDRLKLVLLSDHISLAPEVVEALKTDLLEVIGRYVEIDTSHVVVDFEHRDREIALTANVPILSMRDRPLPPPLPPIVPRANGVATAPAFELDEPAAPLAETSPPSAEAAPPAGEAAPVEAPAETCAPSETPAEAPLAGDEPIAAADSPAAGAPAAEPVAEVPVAVTAEPVVPQAVTPAPANGKRSRRRRRKGAPPPASMPKLSDAAKA